MGVTTSAHCAPQEAVELDHSIGNSFDGSDGGALTSGANAEGPTQLGLVIAVKRLQEAKTRLAPMFLGSARQSLVLAMLADTIAAAMAAPAVNSVTVVTPDDVVAGAAADLGALVVLDPTPLEHRDPLNSAICVAETVVRGSTSNVVVLQGDLPALRSSEITSAIAAAGAHGRSFIGDRHGTGTVALFGFGVPLNPMFGRDSARRHARSGAVQLVGEWPGLQCDVDTPDDLSTAQRLGVGRATPRAVGRAGAKQTA